jgi:hypothetical protein
MRTVPLLCILVLALLVPSAAQAGPWEAGRALAVAERSWGPIAACERQRPNIVYSAEHAGAYDGWVSVWVWPDGSTTVRDPCTIYLGEHMRGASWHHVCTVVMHEYGHAVGREHSASDRDVMHATGGAGIDPRCADRGRAILGLPAPRTAAGRLKYAISAIEHSTLTRQRPRGKM